MRERWSKDEKGKWENHRLNTGIMINIYSTCMSRTCCIYLGGYIYKYKYIYIYLFFFSFLFFSLGQFSFILAAWKNL